jgi:hypothetical protein
VACKSYGLVAVACFLPGRAGLRTFQHPGASIRISAIHLSVLALMERYKVWHPYNREARSKFLVIRANKRGTGRSDWPV